MNKTRTVLLTGGSRGIGAAIAAELRSRNFEIVAPGRAELDLQSASSVDEFVAARRETVFDILINNAGVNFLRPIAELDAQTWSIMLQVNLTSAFQLVQALAPQMQSRGWGRILNISSIFSLVTKESRVAYSMTKAALNALTRSAAVEFGAGGVLVNSLAPGYIDTELTRQNNPPDALTLIRSAIPLGRLADAGEIAKVAAFLVSDDNTYLTGQTVVVDGGFTCR